MAARRTAGHGLAWKLMLVLFLTWFSLPSCSGGPCAAVLAEGARADGTVEDGTRTAKNTKDGTMTLSICRIKNGNPCAGLLTGPKKDGGAFASALPSNFLDLHFGDFDTKAEAKEALAQAGAKAQTMMKDLFCESGSCDSNSRSCKDGPPSSEVFDLYALIEEFGQVPGSNNNRQDPNHAGRFEPVSFKALVILGLGIVLTARAAFAFY